MVGMDGWMKEYWNLAVEYPQSGFSSTDTIWNPEVHLSVGEPGEKPRSTGEKQQITLL